MIMFLPTVCQFWQQQLHNDLCYYNLLDTGTDRQTDRQITWKKEGKKPNMNAVFVELKLPISPSYLILISLCFFLVALFEMIFKMQ